jgi:hypothetical protein
MAIWEEGIRNDRILSPEQSSDGRAEPGTTRQIYRVSAYMLLQKDHGIRLHFIEGATMNELQGRENVLDRNSKFRPREFAALVGGSLIRSSGQAPKLVDRWIKPVILPELDTNDPVALSIAEGTFWNEQMMEHAQFFIMLMPGAELASQRSDARRFQQTFASQLEKTRTAKLELANFAAFNRANIELLKPYSDWQRRLSEEQACGKLRSLVWSTFFDHTATETEHLCSRLEQFSRGDTTTGLTETSSFWTKIMGEHSDFIAHLLDPKERDLIMKAMHASDTFHRMHNNPPSSKSPLESVVDEIIDFKTATEKGIVTGTIKSIIHPTLADHVRREAIKAADDLKRAA